MPHSVCPLVLWAIVLLAWHLSSCTADPEATNFTFVVSNWRTLTAGWDIVGHQQPEDINVSVIWTAKGAKSWYYCSKSTHRSCFLDENDFNGSTNYTFSITLSTQDGASVKIMSMMTRDHVKPAPVESLKVTHVTSRCVGLAWNKDRWYRDVTFRVTYSTFTSINTTETAEQTITICGLTPNMRYNLSVSATAGYGYPSDPRTAHAMTTEEEFLTPNTRYNLSVSASATAGYGYPSDPRTAPAMTTEEAPEATNFTFVVSNWETLTAGWDIVRHQHPEDINVSVIWTARGANYWYNCSKSTHRSCFLDENDFNGSTNYTFNITLSTQDGASVKIMSMMTRDHVKPAPVESLKVTHVTSCCVGLAWNKNRWYRDVTYRVTYSTFTSTNTTETSEQTITICGLTPNTRYNLSVSASATAGYGYPSDPRTAPALTTEEAPEATNFTFVVSNWETLTAGWDIVRHQHPEDINVSVIWTARGANYWYNCSKSTHRSCFLDENDFNGSTNYTFNITLSTQDGASVKIMSMMTRDHVKPAPVESLNVTHFTSRCVGLAWNKNRWSRDVTFRVTYSTFTSINTTETAEQTITICGLTPNTRYNLSVSATAGYGYPSDPRTAPALTTEEEPGAAPNMTDASFTAHKCVNNKRSVTIYLRPPDHTTHNGVLRRYNVTYARGLNNADITDSTVLLEALDCNVDYNVSVYAANDVGMSPPFTLRIPKLGDVLPPTDVLVAFDNESVNVSWKSASQEEKNWTISWNIFCVWNHDVQDCENQVDWIKSDNNESFVKVPLKMPPDKIQFAVSMTTAGGSSGMVLSSCVYNVSKSPKDKPAVLSVKSQPNLGLTVKWSPERCHDAMLITEFRVEYCHNANYVTCDTTSISSESDTYVIPGLLKDVTYRVRIRQRTVAGLDGVFSDPVYHKVIDTRFPVSLIGWITIGCLIFLIGLGYTLAQCIKKAHHKWNEYEEISLPHLYVISGVQETSPSAGMNTIDSGRGSRGPEDDRASRYQSLVPNFVSNPGLKNEKKPKENASFSVESLDTDYTRVIIDDDSMPGHPVPSFQYQQLTDEDVWADSAGSSDESLPPYVTAGTKDGED
ncbi:receptor-type tyrosine-protein phosphatase S-like [Haliotis cracherodii]|uniref:receptor-type tyrosine-protein phosphatase S-like n=1 Tax=Haliotis cracherodii TaxID=6455 RepID=UPI0039E76560